MICYLQSAKIKKKKVECIVYCQKMVRGRANLDFRHVFEEFSWANLCSMNLLYYVLFISMILAYLFSNKYCTKYYKPGQLDPELEDSLTYRLCANRDRISLNAGSGFLAFAAFRAFYNHVTRKAKEKARK